MQSERSAMAIRKSVQVACSVEDAFRLFTEEIGTWWPLATKSSGWRKP